MTAYLTLLQRNMDRVIMCRPAIIDLCHLQRFCRSLSTLQLPIMTIGTVLQPLNSFAPVWSQSSLLHWSKNTSVTLLFLWHIDQKCTLMALVSRHFRRWWRNCVACIVPIWNYSLFSFRSHNRNKDIVLFVDGESMVIPDAWCIAKIKYNVIWDVQRIVTVYLD